MKENYESNSDYSETEEEEEELQPKKKKIHMQYLSKLQIKTGLSNRARQSLGFYQNYPRVSLSSVALGVEKHNSLYICLLAPIY